MELITCSICRIPQPINEFGFRSCKRYGRKRKKHCNTCNNTYHRSYRVANPDKELLIQAKRRAKKRGIPFNLTIDDIHVPTHCPVLGIKLVVGTGSTDPRKALIKDNSPTIDRIDPHKGYTKGNVQVISWRANRLKGDGSLDEHEKILLYMRATCICEKHAVPAAQLPYPSDQ